MENFSESYVKEFAQINDHVLRDRSVHRLVTNKGELIEEQTPSLYKKVFIPAKKTVKRNKHKNGKIRGPSKGKTRGKRRH
jgi:hypothetical protein